MDKVDTHVLINREVMSRLRKFETHRGDLSFLVEQAILLYVELKERQKLGAVWAMLDRSKDSNSKEEGADVTRIE